MRELGGSVLRDCRLCRSRRRQQTGASPVLLTCPLCGARGAVKSPSSKTLRFICFNFVAPRSLPPSEDAGLQIQRAMSKQSCGVLPTASCVSVCGCWAARIAAPAASLPRSRLRPCRSALLASGGGAPAAGQGF